MKKTIIRKFLVVLLLIVGKASLAQNEALDSINLQLRQLFSNLSKPANPKYFLYDMAAHTTDSIYYQANCSETNETSIWYRVYEEMFQSAYDTTTLLHPEQMLTNGNSFFRDTIPIGIINYSFYRFKSDALTTDTYFDFDTINNVLTDKTVRPDFPYDEDELFISAP